MPRATRAALRAQELVDEATTAASIALPPTPTKERTVLGEISNNPTMTVETPFDKDSEPKKLGTKGKKGKGGKKAKKGAKTKEGPQKVDVLEDDEISNHSDAVEQACTELLQNQSESVVLEQTAVPDRTKTPPSPAVQMATRQAKDNGSELTADQSVVLNEVSEALGESSSGQTDLTKTGEQDSAAHGDEALVGQIKNQSPGKRVSRIEDSVEALDALEEAIEQVDQAIPATASDRSSPADTRKPNPKPKGSKTTTKAPKATSKPAQAPSKNDSDSLSTRKRASVAQKASGRPSTINATSASKQNEVNALTRATSQEGPDMRPPKRVSSIHKAPFQPTKSAKPITKSNFELPGEAVARKLKEQREERQKREEASQAKASKSKTKPLRISQAPEVKLTATAKARLSLAQQSAAGKTNRTSPPPRRTGPTPLPSTRKSVQINQPSASNSLHVAKKTTPSSANTSAKRGPSLSSSLLSRQSNTLSQSRSAPSAEELIQQKSRGKEVFGRTKVLLSDKDKEKKAKEEAARKARVDAAERGRLASREWAEKQKARKLASQKANGSPNGKVAAA